MAIIISVAAVGTVGTWKSYDSDTKAAILEKLVKIDKEEIKQSGIFEGGKDVLNSLEEKINPAKKEALGIVNMI